MKKAKLIIARNTAELAEAIGLSPADAVNIEIRRKINEKIIQTVASSGLTHAEAAKLARTSRSRLTALLNRNTASVSTDLMLKILLALGYRATIKFSRNRSAA
jgi:predicted XRE-type DNA-binding protein